MHRRRKPRIGGMKSYRQSGTRATRTSKAWRKNPFRRRCRTTREARAAPKGTSKFPRETRRTYSPQTSRTDARLCRTVKQAQNAQAPRARLRPQRTKPKPTRSFSPPFPVFAQATAQLCNRRNAPIQMQPLCSPRNRPATFAQKIAVRPRLRGKKLRRKNRKHA